MGVMFQRAYVRISSQFRKFAVIKKTYYSLVWAMVSTLNSSACNATGSHLHMYRSFSLKRVVTRSYEDYIQHM